MMPLSKKAAVGHEVAGKQTLRELRVSAETLAWAGKQKRVYCYQSEGLNQLPLFAARSDHAHIEEE